MRINKWVPIVLAINIGALCFALYVAITYQHQNNIVLSEQPITDYSILKVDGGGHKLHSMVKIAYAGKDYNVGIDRKLYKNIEKAKFFYDKQHDTVFEKDYLCMRHVVCFFVPFAFSLLLWRYPEVRKYKATRKDILKERKNIFLKDALPILKAKGFVEEPFKTSNFGWCGFGYIYDMCRLRKGRFLEFVSVKIPQGDKYIQIFINAFEVTPQLGSLSTLKEMEGIKYFIRPNNEKEMRLDSDFIKGAPVLSKQFWFGGLKLGHYFTEIGYNNQVGKLKEKVKSKVSVIDAYFDKWYGCHSPNLVKWDGELVERR